MLVQRKMECGAVGVREAGSLFARVLLSHDAKSERRPAATAAAGALRALGRRSGCSQQSPVLDDDVSVVAGIRHLETVFKLVLLWRAGVT